jgi:predicted enzyme related to lactoylglutathione lyase
MPLKDSYSNGQACWAENSTDLELSKHFYAELFNWKFEEFVPGDPTFLKATLGGNLVASLRQKDAAMSFWNLHFSVENIEEAAALIVDAGAQVEVTVEKISNFASRATFTDTLGAKFSIWQKNTLAGFQEVNSLGAFCWAELCTDNFPASNDFYCAAMQWDAVQGAHDVMDYSVFKSNGKTIAGSMRTPPTAPSQVKSFWGVYFMVQDTDETARSVDHLGGEILIQPMDIPEGRFAMCRDTSGSIFNVLAIATRN